MANKAKSASIVLGLLIFGGVIAMGFILPPPTSMSALEYGIATGVIGGPPGPGAGRIIYAQNTTIDNNTNALRVDSGNTVLNSMAELMAFTGYINSTLLRNCTINDENNFDYFCLYGNARMTMRNIDLENLNISLFENSELILDNCKFNQLGAAGNSRATISNSTIYTVTDSTMTLGKVSSVITIQSNSTIAQVMLGLGSSAIIDNSTITSFQITTSIQANFVEAIITNSSIGGMSIWGPSKVTAHGAIITSVTVIGDASLILDSSTIGGLLDSITCYTGTTSVTNSAFPAPGTYVNNTKLISTVPALAPSVVSVVVNGSARANIQGIAPSTAMFVYSHDSGTAQVNDTISMIPNLYVYTYEDSRVDINNSTAYLISTSDDSQLTAFNATVDNFVMAQNSNATIHNSSIDKFTINATAPVSIHNSSINVLASQVSDHGSPAGNINITNTSISIANVYGGSVIIFEDCAIATLYSGAVIYTGTFILNTTHIIGSYVNYTTLISTVPGAGFVAYLEVNDTAAFDARDIDMGSLQLILYHDANTTVTNCTIGFVNLQGNTKATLSNVTANNGIISYDASIFTVSEDSIINGVNCMGSSSGTITDSMVQGNLDLYQQSRVTVTECDLTGEAKVMGSNTLDYTLKIYNSTVHSLIAMNW